MSRSPVYQVVLEVLSSDAAFWVHFTFVPWHAMNEAVHVEVGLHL